MTRILEEEDRKEEREESERERHTGTPMASPEAQCMRRMEEGMMRMEAAMLEMREEGQEKEEMDKGGWNGVHGEWVEERLERAWVNHLNDRPDIGNPEVLVICSAKEWAARKASSSARRRPWQGNLARCTGGRREVKECPQPC